MTSRVCAPGHSEPLGQPGAVDRYPAAAHATDARGGSVGPSIGLFEPVEMAHGFFAETAQKVAESRGLRRLQVGRVGPDRVRVRHRLGSHGVEEAADCLLQIEQAVAQRQAERDAAGLPPGAAGMQPPGDGAQASFQLALAAVVGVAIERVVREVLGWDLQQLE